MMYFLGLDEELEMRYFEAKRPGALDGKQNTVGLMMTTDQTWILVKTEVENLWLEVDSRNLSALGLQRNIRHRRL